MPRMIKIYDALIEREGRVINKSRIAALVREFNKKFKTNLNPENTIKYLARHGYLKRILSGYYYINSLDERKRGYCKFESEELLFDALNKLKIKWYAGLNYALHAAGLGWQVPNTISIINERFSGDKNILGLKVRFYKIKGNLIFGFKKSKTRNNIEYKYSLPAKTYLDMAYLRISRNLVKKKETNTYLKRYPKWVGMK